MNFINLDTALERAIIATINELNLDEKVWVKDPRVKKGGYYRELKPGQKAGGGPALAQRAGKSKRKMSAAAKGALIGAGVNAALAGAGNAVVGGKMAGPGGAIAGGLSGAAGGAIGGAVTGAGIGALAGMAAKAAKKRKRRRDSMDEAIAVLEKTHQFLGK